MAQPPKRLPGERNPSPDGDQPMHVARQSWMGGEDHGIARSVIALFAWRKRRKQRRDRTAG
jgi:hypothetical protein